MASFIEEVVNGLGFVVVEVVGGLAVDTATTEEGVMMVSLGSTPFAFFASGFNVGAVSVSIRSTSLL